MMGNPTVHEIVHGERGMLRGVQSCISGFCLVSAVTLVYAAIDALAGLTIPATAVKSSGQDFIDWVGQYYLPHLKADLNAGDLWAARCGVLHSYSRHSDLSRRNSARSLVYRWRDAHVAFDRILQSQIDDGAVVVEVEALSDALRAAVTGFQRAIDQDEDLRERVEHHVKRLLCYRPSSPNSE